MESFILEGCVDSVESAEIAQAGGANRLELCSNLIIGGTTPDIHTFRAVRSRVRIPVRVLLRPRFGDFLYTPAEFEVLLEDAAMFRDAGADGVVIGILRPDGTLDRTRMERLVARAGNMRVTLHRAFDVCRDPFEALEDAVSLGVDTILTSGQQDSCQKGRDLLRALVEKAAGRLDILIGGGVSAPVIRDLAAYTGARSFHLSGKTTLQSGMEYRREGVNMGLPSLSEFEIWRTDKEKIAAARRALESV